MQQETSPINYMFLIWSFPRFYKMIVCGQHGFLAASSSHLLLLWKHFLNHVTLCILSDLHRVFVVIWNLNTAQGQPPIQPLSNTMLCSQKKAKVTIESRGERLNILPKFRYWVMAQMLSGWAHVTYEKFWICWVDLKQEGIHYGCRDELCNEWLPDRCCSTCVRYVPFWNGKDTSLMTFSARECLCCIGKAWIQTAKPNFKTTWGTLVSLCFYLTEKTENI